MGREKIVLHYHRKHGKWNQTRGKGERYICIYLIDVPFALKAFYHSFTFQGGTV